MSFSPNEALSGSLKEHPAWSLFSLIYAGFGVNGVLATTTWLPSTEDSGSSSHTVTSSVAYTARYTEISHSRFLAEFCRSWAIDEGSMVLNPRHMTTSEQSFAVR